MGRREGPSEERRQTILQAAEAEFSEQGYHGASIRAIAKRAAVSSALLYWFFPDKAQLFIAVLTSRLQGITSVQELPAAAYDLPPEVFLPQFARQYLRLATDPVQERLVRLLLGGVEREPQLIAALGEQITGRLIKPVTAYFTQQVASGRMRPVEPAFAAQAFVGMFIGFALRARLLREPVIQGWDIDAYVDTAVDVFLTGLLTEGGKDHDNRNTEQNSGQDARSSRD